MNDKLVTLFGGGGFVGRYVAQALLASGARVRIAQRDPRQTFFIRPLGGLGQTQFVAADVTRPDSVARAVAGADHVVNAVGSFRNAAAINTAGARAVAVAANEAGAHGLVHISAIGADPEASSANGRRQGEGDIGVGEFRRDPMPRGSDDLCVVVGQLGQRVDLLPGRLVG